MNWLHSIPYLNVIVSTCLTVTSYLSVSLMKSVVLLLELRFSLLKSADCEGITKRNIHSYPTNRLRS